MAHRILVVDDSFYMRTILKNILLDAGYDVIGEAANAESALEYIREYSPDVVTLDVILPDNTGLEVLREIRKSNTSLKVVMVSAVGQESVVDEALALGALAYIIKPFSEEKVQSIMKNVLDQND
ncbi:MAG: response regulator [Bacteroidia bacterium]